MDNKTSKPTTSLVNRAAALTHPIRSAIWEYLQIHGEATSTSLSGALDLSSGLTSYHLRKMSTFGLIEEDTSQGVGRERWWRLRAIEVDLNDADETGLTQEEQGALLANTTAIEARSFVNFWSKAWAGEIDPKWVEESNSTQLIMNLTIEQFEELASDISQMLDKWGNVSAANTQENRQVNEGAGTERVQLTVRAFPL